MEIVGKEIIAEKGRYIHRINDDICFTRGMLRIGESINDFVEVDERIDIVQRPPFKGRVISRIRERYTIDDEIAIIRQKDAKPSEYNEYYSFVERVKKEEKGA